jgi:hypothetical protein
MAQINPDLGIVNIFFQLTRRVIDETGVYPMSAVARTTDRIHVMALALEPCQFADAIEERLADESCLEFIFGFETWATGPAYAPLERIPGTALDSCVVVLHGLLSDEGEPQINVGILEYRWDAEQEQAIAKPIDWDNGYMIERMADYAQQLTHLLNA